MIIPKKISDLFLKCSESSKAIKMVKCLVRRAVLFLLHVLEMNKHKS